MTNFEYYSNEIKAVMNKITSNAMFCDVQDGIRNITGMQMYTWFDFFNWGVKTWVPPMNETEKFILENLKEEWKWIARNRDGSLNTFKKKPDYKGDEKWWGVNNDPFLFSGYIYTLFGIRKKDLFAFIKWSDDEPWSIEELRGLANE